MTSFDNLTEKQKRVLDDLPATIEDLAEKYDISRSGVRSIVTRARGNGVEVPYDPERGMYLPPEDAPEEIEKAERIDSEAVESIVEDLRGEGLTYRDLATEYDLSKDESMTILDDLEREGYTVEFKSTDARGTRLFYIPEERDKTYVAGDGDGVYRFALMGDTHLGSKAEHLEELHDFYDRLEEEGVEHVYHAGDISDGWKVHKGHINVVKGGASGWHRLLGYVVDNYPVREGVDTFFIEGNHDRKYHRRNGVHFGELISRRREDLNYLGDSQATIVFDPENDIDLELIHPSGGKPYTQGYRAQTLYRERPAEERPTIAGIGHLHGKLYGSAEDVEAFYVGCWKGLTTYGKRKGHDSEIGGWIVEIEIKNGELRRVSPNWIGYESRDESPKYSPDDLSDMSS